MTETDGDRAQEGAAVFDFTHLAIEDSTARYELPLVAPGAYVVCKPAMEHNRGYRDGLLALGTHRYRRAAQGAERSEEDERLDREDDIKLYPKHVIIGWGGIVNTAGLPVPFTEDNCRAFLRALPKWQLSRLILFAKMPSNFVREAEIPSQQHVDQIVGN